MGAELWYYETPWAPDPEDALRTLQIQFLTASYDVPTLVREHLASARDAVRITEADGDPYGILDLYRDDLAFLEEIAARPLPDDPLAQIDLLRKIHASGGQGIGNVLDVTAVSEQGGVHRARRLRSDEVCRYCDTGRPNRQQAELAVSRVHEGLQRGESVCFPFFSDRDAETPAGWFFIGNTVD